VVDCDDSAAAPPPADLIVKCRRVSNSDNYERTAIIFPFPQLCYARELEQGGGQGWSVRRQQETAAAHILFRTLTNEEVNDNGRRADRRHSPAFRRPMTTATSASLHPTWPGRQAAAAASLHPTWPGRQATAAAVAAEPK
jgi:hypothetical protein